MRTQIPQACKINAYGIDITSNWVGDGADGQQAVETALALWVAMQKSVSQMYDNTGLAKSWGPEI